MIFLQALWWDYDDFSFFSFSTAGCCRSGGHCLLNLLLAFGGLLFSASSLLLCPSKLFMVECCQYVYPSLTNGICRWLWRVSLETYHGALVIRRRTLDWNLWIIFVFDGFAQPHSCIPYVHMGFILHLYSRSLFSMDNLDLRPQNQDISRSLKFSFWRFVSTCFCHVSFWEGYNPK
jgi:hypothetical protein